MRTVRDNGIHRDIDLIADWGFDHIRLPFHYKVLYDPDLGAFREEGFDLFDRFLGWCKANGLYVILDMHAAPGGQNGGNISDSDGTARLWSVDDGAPLAVLEGHTGPVSDAAFSPDGRRAKASRAIW